MELSRISSARQNAHQQEVAFQAALDRTTILVMLFLGMVALLPRVLGLADFLTADEANHWIRQTNNFLMALQDGNWVGTLQAGHPGVTRMWLGSLGLLIERMALDQGWISASSRLEHLAWMRLPSAVLLALLIPLNYLLLRRLVKPSTALFGALLWASSPMIISHDRLAHLDGLLTSFITLTVLCVLIACRAARPLPWILGAGVCSGLALLTKSPALILLPTVGLLLFWQLPAASLLDRFRRSIGYYLLWLAMLALTVFVLWPVLWVDPALGVGRYLDALVSEGGRPNGDGQFFLGQTIGDPGPFYYLVSNLFRLSIAATVGILALPLALRRATPERRVLLVMGAFVLFWTVVMTMGPKKFDRYMLPTWPLLMVFAGAGWAALAEYAAQALAVLRQRAVPLLLGLVCLIEGATLAWYHPYYLSYFNPLLGGGRVAQNVFLVGWGEGMDQIAAYLRSRPDYNDGMVLSALTATLQPFMSVPVRDVTTLNDAPANYAVVYRESIQRGAFPEIYAAIRQTVPLHTITIHGIDYAQIYQLPKPFDQAVGARFGMGLDLRGVSISREAGQLVVTPAWDVRAPLDRDYLLFMHLLDARGQRVAQIDVAPGGAIFPASSTWLPGQQIAVPVPLPLPADLPAGSYQLVVGLYDPQQGERLALSSGTAADLAFAGADALLLATLTLP